MDYVLCCAHHAKLEHKYIRQDNTIMANSATAFGLPSSDDVEDEHIFARLISFFT